MRLNKIQRLLGTVFLATIITGCSPQLTTETYIHEAGETLPEEVTEYAVFKNPEKAAEATLDLSDVVVDKVGTYEATITLKEKEYTVTVEVVDTTAPSGNTELFAKEVGIDGVITAESYGVHLEDISDFEYGFRNLQLVTAEEGVYKLFDKNLTEAREAGIADISLYDLLDLEFDQENDTWDETGVDISTLEKEIKPETNGLYSVELVAADIYGNADVTKVYILADLSEPVFVQNFDREVEVSSNFEEYKKSMTDGLLIKDNYMGVMTDYATVTNTEIIENSTSKMKMKVSYEVIDIAGNKSTADRTITLKSTFVTPDNVQQVAQQQAQQEQAQSNGFDRAKAEQAFAAVNQQRVAAGLHELAWDESLYDFACTRSTHIVTNFSHNMPDGTYSPTYLNNLGIGYGHGENIAGNFKSITNLVNGWMNSPSHKANILDSRYTSGAMGCYSCNGTYYWVHIFRAE